jgi:hypothetical protein
MPLASSIKYLSERGVTAKEMSPNRYSLHVEGKRYSTLDEASEGYHFRCWDYAPGPGKDDFSVAFSELDDALLAVWYFYFGEPVQVTEWKVPMHQQPNWLLGKLAYRIANAVHVSSIQFEATEESRGADLVAFTSSAGGRPPSEGRYAIALRSQFIACPSASTDSHTLMLRRDLEEAYVVTDQR